MGEVRGTARCQDIIVAAGAGSSTASGPPPSCSVKGRINWILIWGEGDGELLPRVQAEQLHAVGMPRQHTAVHPLCLTDRHINPDDGARKSLECDLSGQAIVCMHVSERQY